MSRAIRYTPAVTMVAAWISAETGVGPAMASGSQVCSGTWADFPRAPPSTSRATNVAVGSPTAQSSPARAITCWISRVPRSR